MFLATQLTYKSQAQARKDLQVAYLGGVAHSTKLMHSLTEKKIATYGIYLAPADLSGYNVCQNSSMCREHCLFGSGHTMMDILSGKLRNVQSRIRKTQLFKQNPEYFMRWMIAEIKQHKAKAAKDGYEFSVRLNCTSDISMADFNLDGVNICDIFPDVQFYDYTKVYSHIENTNLHSNYDLTFSYNGVNWGQCEKALRNNVRVAVVFEDKLPKTYRGVEVIDGDKYDARYYDAKNVIVGLKFKMTASSIKNKKFTMPKTPFVVTKNDMYSVY